MVLDRNEILKMLMEQRINREEALRLLDHSSESPPEENQTGDFDMRQLLGGLKPQISSKDVSSVAAAFLELDYQGRLRLFQVFQSMNLFVDAKEQLDLTGLIAKGGIQPKFQGYVTVLLDMLVKERLVQIEDGLYQATARTQEPALLEKLRAFPDSLAKLREKEPSLTAHCQVLDHCLNSLDAVLSGHTSYEAVRAPMRPHLQDTCSKDHHSRFLNDLSLQLIRAYHRHITPDNQDLQLFEWSSGGRSAGGPLAQALLDMEGHLQFHWTGDHSEDVTFARRRWGADFPFMSFHKLDLNRENSTLDQFAGQADVLVCTNSLHRVAYFPEAMEYCRRLLKPGGLLIIREFLAVRDFTLLTAGLDPRWWRFEDGENRLPHLPIADGDGWMAALDAAGFESLSAVGLPIENRFSFQGLIVARAPHQEEDAEAHRQDDLDLDALFEAPAAEVDFTTTEPLKETADWLQHHEPTPVAEPAPFAETKPLSPAKTVEAMPATETETPLAHAGAQPHLLVRQSWAATPGRPAKQLPQGVWLFMPRGLSEEQRRRLCSLPGAWVLITVGTRFRRLAENEYEVPVDDDGALRLLCHALRDQPPTRIFKWCENQSAADADWQREQHFLQVLALALRGEGRHAEVPTTLLLRGANPYYHRALDGMCQAMRITGGQLQPALLELDPGRSFTAQLRHELRLEGRQVGTRFSNLAGQRRCLVLDPMVAPPVAATALRHQGVYLILGDLDRAALSLADQLHQRAQAQLVVLPWRHTSGGDTAWDRLGSSLQVQPLADLAELEPLLRRLSQEGRPVNGLFYFHHPRQPRAVSVLEHLRRLDQLTQTQTLDFFSIATSGSAYLGEWGSPTHAVDENLCAAFVQQRNAARAAQHRAGLTYCLRIVDETHQGLPAQGLALYRKITGIEDPQATLIADTLLQQPGYQEHDLCLIAGQTDKLLEFIQQETGLLNHAAGSSRSLFQRIHEDVTRLWLQEGVDGDPLQALIDFFGWEPEFLLLEGFQESECVHNLLAYHRDQLLVFYDAQSLPSRQLEHWIIEHLRNILGDGVLVPTATTSFAELPLARASLLQFCRQLGGFLKAKLTPALCFRFPTAAALAGALAERFPQQVDHLLSDRSHWQPVPAAASPPEAAVPTPAAAETHSAAVTTPLHVTADYELIPLSAKSLYILKHKAARLAAFIEDQTLGRLRFLAARQQAQPGASCRLVVLAGSPDQAVEVLKTFAAGRPHPQAVYGVTAGAWHHFGEDPQDREFFTECWRRLELRKLADLWTRGVPIPWPDQVHRATPAPAEAERPGSTQRTLSLTVETEIAKETVQATPPAPVLQNEPVQEPLAETRAPLTEVIAKPEPPVQTAAEPIALEPEPASFTNPEPPSEVTPETTQAETPDSHPTNHAVSKEKQNYPNQHRPSSPSLSEGHLRTFLDLRAALCVLLEIEEKIVNPNESLFHYGLNSIIAVRLKWHIEHVYGVVFPLQEILNNPTLETLSQCLNTLIDQPHETIQRLTHMAPSAGNNFNFAAEIDPDPGNPFPFSAMQNYLRWIRKQMPLGNYYFELEETGLDIKNLRASWEYVVEHHDILRTNLLQEDKQIIADDLPDQKIEVFDLSLPEHDSASFFEDLREHWSQQTFPLGPHPRWKLALVQLPDEVVRIALCIDRMLLDFSSLPILLQTWFAYYRNMEPPLPAGSFSLYMHTKKEVQENVWYQRDLEYWQQRLDHFDPYPVFPGQADYSPNFQRLYAQLAPPTWSALAQRAHRHQVTLPIVLAHTFAATLALFSRHPRFSFLVESNHRLPLFADAGQVVGPFHMLALCQYDPNPTASIADLFRQNLRNQWCDLNHAAARAEATLAVSDKLGDFPVILQMSHHCPKLTEFKGWNHVCQWIYSRNALPKSSFIAHFTLGERTLEIAWEVPREGLSIFRQMLDFFFMTLLHLANCNWEEKPILAAMVPLLTKHPQAGAMLANCPDHILAALQTHLEHE